MGRDASPLSSTHASNNVGHARWAKKCEPEGERLKVRRDAHLLGSTCVSNKQCWRDRPCQAEVRHWAKGQDKVGLWQLGCCSGVQRCLVQASGKMLKRCPPKETWWLRCRPCFQPASSNPATSHLFSRSLHSESDNCALARLFLQLVPCLSWLSWCKLQRPSQPTCTPLRYNGEMKNDPQASPRLSAARFPGAGGGGALELELALSWLEATCPETRPSLAFGSSSSSLTGPKADSESEAKSMIPWSFFLPAKRLASPQVILLSC